MLTQIYKPGQGKYSRLGSGFTVAIIVAIGCYALFKMLRDSDVNLWITTMVPARESAGRMLPRTWKTGIPSIILARPS